jgi:hypothetical protein
MTHPSRADFVTAAACGNSEVPIPGRASVTSLLLTPTFYVDLSAQKQYAIFPVNGAGPKVGAAHSHCSVGRVNDYILVGHSLDFAAGEAEGSVS